MQLKMPQIVKVKRNIDTARCFNKSFFETKLSNGKKNKKLRLIYSTCKGKAYCGPCLILNTPGFGKQRRV